MSRPLFTVVICTFNRAGLLAGALQTVCAQTMESDRYEVLVVDNNSTDETAVVVKEAEGLHTFVRYIFEPRQGLSFARNRGYQAAEGEYVAYLDDDCKVPPEWLATAEQVIARVSPAVFGGPYFAYYDSGKPKWFRDEYGSHVQGESSRMLERDEYLDGANMFARRSLLEELGGFSPEFGMAGHSLGYGEEVRLQRRMRELRPGISIYYEPQLYVYHLVARRKMTLGWKLHQMFVIGRDWHRVVHDGTQGLMTGRDLLRETARTVKSFCVDVVRGIFRRDRRRYRFLRNYLYEHTFVSVHRLGQLHEQFVGRFASRRGRT